MDSTEMALARTLGFLRPEKYAHIERERRWLCEALPDLPVTRRCEITDTYITNSRMRLREMRFGDGTVERKLTKKADMSPDRRIITTIYLSPDEHALLAGLPGRRLHKRRSYFAADPAICVDGFEDGTFVMEVEFPSAEAANTYTAPDWCGEEVTEDPDYSGHALANKLGT